MNYKDSSGTKKTLTQHAFLIEDVAEMAKRNNCKASAVSKTPTMLTNHRQSTTVSIFEYMIGNTDWSTPGGHNIKLINEKDDPASKPYVVPYDFDFSGLVNTNYSAPDERLGIENVRERTYRGLPRPISEVNDVLDIFNKEKANMYAVINNFNLLTPRNKRDMTDYLDQFFKTISDPEDVKKIFSYE
ncbi:MAG: hypothetical protein ABI166_13805 [Mucilaginibacter sp.]